MRKQAKKTQSGDDPGNRPGGRAQQRLQQFEAMRGLSKSGPARSSGKRKDKAAGSQPKK